MVCSYLPRVKFSHSGIHKQIFRLAVPAFLSNISIPLLGAVDIALIGNYGNAELIGSLAVGTMFFNMLFWGFGFLRMGTTGPTAQAYGRSDKAEISLVFYRAIASALIIAVLIILFQEPLMSLGLSLFEASQDVLEGALTYISIRIWSAPAIFIIYALNGWFLGVQNARFPLLLTITENLVNIVLNIYFVAFLDMGVYGVALGSLIAGYVALLVGLLLFVAFYRRSLVPSRIGKVFELQGFKRFFLINTDVFIRTACLIFSYYYFIDRSAAMGEQILAVNAILIQFWHIYSYGVDGFANAAESLSGKYVGRKDMGGLKLSIRWIFIWATILSVLVTLVYVLIPQSLIRIFTNDENLITACIGLFAWTQAAPLINAWCFIWDGIYLGTTATAAMRNSMIISTFLVFVPVFWISSDYLGPHAIWLAMTSFMLSRGLILTVFAPKEIFGRVEVA